MTQREIADELFHAGKEVKKFFLTEIAKPQPTSPKNGTTYLQYIQLLDNLNVMYHSLDIGDEDISKTDVLINSARQLFSSKDEAFITEYLSALDSILINTLHFLGNICLIRRSDPVPGLASHIITNLGQIVASINSGHLPIIDTVYTDNMFSELSHLRSVNAWELYFSQPCGLTLQDVPPEKEVTVLDSIPAFMPNYNMDCLMNPGLMTFWRNVMRKYMPFSPKLRAILEDSLKHLPFHTDSKVLGVLCRGTDYTMIRPHNHPVQPSPEMVLAKSLSYMEKYQCNYCYLATEDEGILQTFRHSLKDRLLTTQEIYYSSGLKDTINQANHNLSIDLHQKNTEYLTALFLLSQCQYFIGGRTSGTVVSLLLSEGFDEICIWDLGRYGIDDTYTLRSYLY